MTLRELLDTVIASDEDHWHRIGCWGAFSGPSYREHFTFYDTYEGQENVLHHDSQSMVAAYMPDVSITMAWGLDCNPDFKEEWANSFPDPQASSHFVDLFYNNALVFRDVYVKVDGGRCDLPLPSKVRGEDKKVVALEVPRDKYRFYSLLDSISRGGQEFEQYFSQARFMMVEREWPDGLS